MNSTPPTPTLSLQARRHGVVTQVDQALRTHVQLRPGCRVLVGVSGGADSLGLLIALSIIARRSNAADRIVAEPLACHVHHHLRPDAQADADAEHVQAVCERLGITCVIEHVHPAAEPGNLAANARHLRYAAMSSVAQQQSIRFIATGHHADDQLETIVMALCRGAGPQGLAGIRWRRALHTSHPRDIQLIRPMLGVTHDECCSLCEAARVQWREDASNAVVMHARNRLRRDVLPILEERWPGAARRAVLAGDLMALCADLLDERLDAVFGSPERRTWDRAKLVPVPRALIAAGVRRAAVQASPAAADHLGSHVLGQIADAIASTSTNGKHFDLSGGLVLDVTAHKVTLSVPNEAQRR